MESICAKWWEAVCLIKAPSAMTAPRAREQRRPPSPPDRQPPRRGGGSSPCTSAASAAGRPAGPARLFGARRGLLRSARTLAAAALLALTGALALPAQAQADVLVSNIGQTSDATSGLTNGELTGQVFKVASGGGNYTLKSIEVPVVLVNTTALTAADIALLSASLWSADEFEDPVSSLQALDVPSSISDGDTATFTDASGTTLEAGKRYAVVFVYNKSSAELSIKAVGSGSEDGTSLAGWDISNHQKFKTATETIWSSDGNSLQIRVNGTAAANDTPTLAVGHSRGAGRYREDGCMAGSCAGEAEATLTGAWPYAGLVLSDRLSAWAAAGHGAGELRFMPGGNGSPFTADLTMTMGAAGLRGEVLTPPPEGGIALAVKGDARFTRTETEAAKDADGTELEAASADVSLLRAGVEGSRRFALAGDAAGMVLTPSFEVGARLDGGDAETGLGVDLGGGLAFVVPKQGVALDLKARGLIAHEAPGFREWGASASLTWDPRPETGRGLALSLVRSWGGSPSGGMNALFGSETPAGTGADDDAGRLEAELGYGLPTFGGGFTGTPNIGIGLSDTARDYRLGWRLTPARKGAPGFEIGLDATRREATNADAVHGLMLRGTVRW